MAASTEITAIEGIRVYPLSAWLKLKYLHNNTENQEAHFKNTRILTPCSEFVSVQKYCLLRPLVCQGMQSAKYSVCEIPFHG